MKKFKFLFLFFAFFLSINGVFASTRQYDRNSVSNNGVNKRWTINNKNINNVKRTPLVDASEKVYDFADILTDSEEKEIYKIIKSFINKYDMDMVFVSTSFSYSSDRANEDYAADFYDYNDFGLDYDHYDGILIFRNAYTSDPYYGIYFFGDAQLYFSDYRIDSLLDDIYTLFHSKNYVAGLDKAIKIISSDIDSGIPSSFKNKYVDSMSILRTKYHVPVLICFVISAVATLIIMLILVGKNKMIKKATLAKEYLDKNSVNFTERTDNFVRSHTTHYTVSSSSGSGGSHHGSSGGGHSGGGRHG